MGNSLLFVCAIVSDWIAAMSTIGSVALCVYAGLWNSSASRVAIFIAAALCFLLAAYRVWNKQFERAERYKAHLLDEYEADIQRVQTEKMPRGKFPSSAEEERFYCQNIIGEVELIREALKRWKGKQRAANGLPIERFRPPGQ